jgi:hypothetical protein
MIGNIQRWRMVYPDTDANFRIYSYDATGAHLTTVMAFHNDTGLVTVNHPPTDASNYNIATTWWVRNHANQHWLPLSGGHLTGKLYADTGLEVSNGFWNHGAAHFAAPAASAPEISLHSNGAGAFINGTISNLVRVRLSFPDTDAKVRLHYYDAAQTYIGSGFTFDPANGLIQVNQPPGDANDYHVATTWWVRNHANQHWLPLAGGSLSGRLYANTGLDASNGVWLHGDTNFSAPPGGGANLNFNSTGSGVHLRANVNGVTRWRVAFPDTDGFIRFNRHDAAGTYVAAALTINADTGFLTINHPPPDQSGYVVPTCYWVRTHTALYMPLEGGTFTGPVTFGQAPVVEEVPGATPHATEPNQLVTRGEVQSAYVAQSDFNELKAAFQEAQREIALLRAQSRGLD